MPARLLRAGGQCWTLATIAEVVRRRFGVEYTGPATGSG
jgi:transposase